MKTTGHHRLLWQMGLKAKYADVTIEIAQEIDGGGTIRGLEKISPPWRAGALKGLALAKEALAGTVDFAKISITFAAFHGHAVDTNAAEVAYATFHAMIDALDRPDLAEVFRLDESTGEFSVSLCGS
jgi:hypothetical protein